MSSPYAGCAFLALLVVALLAVHIPLGDYVYRIYTSERDWRVEKIDYRAFRVDARNQQPWHACTRKAKGLIFPHVSSALARGTGRMWP